MSDFDPTVTPRTGDTVADTVTFLVNGTPTDPSTVTLRFRCGAGTLWTTWTWLGVGNITQTGTGVFTAPVPTWGPGPLEVEWIGTGLADKRIRKLYRLLPLP